MARRQIFPWLRAQSDKQLKLLIQHVADELERRGLLNDLDRSAVGLLLTAAGPPVECAA